MADNKTVDYAHQFRSDLKSGVPIEMILIYAKRYSQSLQDLIVKCRNSDILEGIEDFQQAVADTDRFIDEYEYKIDSPAVYKLEGGRVISFDGEDLFMITAPINRHTSPALLDAIARKIVKRLNMDDTN